MQALAALALSAADVLAIYTIKNFDALTARAIMVTLLSANVLGVVMSLSLHRWSRNQFTALQREQEIRGQLETALAEIRTLRGIIPICAHCNPTTSL